MNKMSFGEALSRGFKNMFNFQGRARRKEFWCYTLVIAAVLGIVGSIIAAAAGLEATDVTPYTTLISLVLTLGCYVRRLHDTGKSGWWMLIYLTGIGSIIIFIWTLLDSKPGDNKYGPNPKGVVVVDQSKQA